MGPQIGLDKLVGRLVGLSGAEVWWVSVGPQFGGDKLVSRLVGMSEAAV